MRTHNLKNAPGYQLTYTIISPAQEQTHDQEGFEIGIEIDDIHILGNRVGDDKFKELMAANGSVWIGEIIDELKRCEKLMFLN